MEDQKLLTELMDLKRIKVHVECNDKEQAINMVGNMLLEQGYIEETYINAMIKLCKDLNSYIVVAPGVAMPHARPADGAKKTGFSIITLKKPLVFGHKKNDPVCLVIGFSAINNYEHIRAMQELMNMVTGKEIMRKIINSATEEELFRNIQRFEKVYIEQVNLNV